MYGFKKLSNRFPLSQKSTDLFFYGTILLIFLLSSLAMTNGFTKKSLLLDEAFLARNIAEFPDGIYYHSAPSAPLFYFFSYIVVSIFGQSEWVYRLIPLVSAISGFLLFIQFLLKNFKKFIVLNTVFLLATSVPFIHYASNAHPYAVDFLCSSVLLILAYQYTIEPATKRWIIWQITSIVCICFSFPALFVYTSSCIVILLNVVIKKEWKELRQKLVSLIPSGIIIFIVLFFFVMRLSQGRQELAYWTSNFPYSFLPWVYVKWIYQNTDQILGYLFWYGKSGLLGIFMILIGTAWTISKKKYNLMMLCWGPILITIFVASFQKWPYGPLRVMLFSLPFFLILIGSGLELIWESIKSTWSKGVTVLACIVILIPQSWTLKKGFEYIEDSEEAVRTLSETIKPKIIEDDYFLIYYTAAVQFQYYFPEYSDNAIIQSWSDSGDSTQLSHFVTSNISQIEGRFWMIFSHIMNQENELMISTAQKHSRLLESYTFSGCSAVLFENLK